MQLFATTLEAPIPVCVSKVGLERTVNKVSSLRIYHFSAQSCVKVITKVPNFLLVHAESIIK